MPDTLENTPQPKINNRAQRFRIGFLGACWGAVLAGAIVLLIGLAFDPEADFGMAMFAVAFGLPGLGIGIVCGIPLGFAAEKLYTTWERHGFKPWRIRVARFLIGALPVILLFSEVTLASQKGTPPSDSAMIKNFQQHKGAFERLEEMSQTDKKLTRLDVGSAPWSDPADLGKAGISYVRRAEYTILLHLCNVPSGFQTDGAGAVSFFYWLRGMVASSEDTKGYFYSKTVPSSLCMDLDKCERNHPDDLWRGYRHIEGNWYLFYEYEP